MHVTHLDSESNEIEAHDKLRHDTRDAGYTVVATVQVNNKVKEPSVKEKEKNYHPDRYSRCGAVGCDLSKEEKYGNDSICVTYRFGDKHTFSPRASRTLNEVPILPTWPWMTLRRVTTLDLEMERLCQKVLVEV